jgi:hypothetical protein
MELCSWANNLPVDTASCREPQASQCYSEFWLRDSCGVGIEKDFSFILGVQGDPHTEGKA